MRVRLDDGGYIQLLKCLDYVFGALAFQDEVKKSALDSYESVRALVSLKLLPRENIGAVVDSSILKNYDRRALNKFI